MVRFNEYLWGDDFSLVITQELSEQDFDYHLWYEHGFDLRCRETRDLELWLDMTGNLDADVSFGRLETEICAQPGLQADFLSSQADVRIRGGSSGGGSIGLFIANQQPLEPEFQKIVDENFWDLLSE